MLALLGWNPGTEQELFTLEELVQAFDLKRVSKSGAKFSPEKTNWFNQQYLQTKSDEELTKLYIPILSKKGTSKDEKYIEKVVSLIKERAVFVSDFWNLSDFFFQAPTSYDEKAVKKAIKDDTKEVLENVIGLVKSVNDFTTENVQNTIKSWIVSNEIGFGKVMMPLRLALVGALQGPDVFEIIEMIGKEETISRIEKAIETLL